MSSNRLLIYIESNNQYLRLGFESILIAMREGEGYELEVMPSGSPLLYQERSIILFDDGVKALLFKYSLFFNAGHTSQCQLTNVFIAGFSRGNISHSDLSMPCIRAIEFGGGRTLSEKISKTMNFVGKNCRCPKCPLTVLNNSDKLLVRLISEAKSNAYILGYMGLTSKTLSYKKHKIKRLLGMNSIFQLYNFVLSLKNNYDHHNSAL